MLDVHRLSILRAIREHSSLAAAARSLYLSDSVVSHHMDRLEREAGVPLLLRSTGSRGRLTAAGELLAAHAEDILGRLEAARSEMTALAAQRSGRLRVLTVGPPAALVPVVADLRTAFPRLAVDLTHDDRADAAHLLCADEVDVALLCLDARARWEPAGVRTVVVGAAPESGGPAPDRLVLAVARGVRDRTPTVEALVEVVRGALATTGPAGHRDRAAVA